MRSLKIKFGPSGLVSLQNPAAANGKSGNAITCTVTSIPDGITSGGVIAAFAATCIFKIPEGGDIPYQNLGTGKILRA